MTTTLAATTTASTGSSSRTDSAREARERHVLTIAHMPRHLRLRVEGLMYEHLSEPSAAPSLVEVWDVPWFTRWRREPSRAEPSRAEPSRAEPSRAGTVSCREVIEAPAEELATFRSALAEVAQTFGFEASVD